MRFTFMHNTFDVPDGIDVVVSEVKSATGTFVDFNFTKGGKIIPMFGGTDDDGIKLQTWDELGIRRVE